MHIVMFCHSMMSDWNHGNAHFLRGIATELRQRGHRIESWEPADAWSLQNLLQEHGTAPIGAFRAAYPLLDPGQYLADTDVERLVDGADLVLIHEWNDPGLVARLGEVRRDGGGFRLLFHDTHHRAATAPHEMARYDLRHYDGVLAFGAAVRDIYLERGWAERAWTWHEAADTRVFAPLPDEPHEGDLVWIGNWGDDERNAELREYLIDPVRDLHLGAAIHGVRYPDAARTTLAEAGIDYRGWLPNFVAPRVYARFRVTVHVPRAPYVQALPGIPTIRPFEALACGIPLVTAHWNDAEGLFTPGADYLVAGDGAEMRRHLRDVLADADLAAELAAHGRRTILQRHTCAHRVDELLEICAQLGITAAGDTAATDIPSASLTT